MIFTSFGFAPNRLASALATACDLRLVILSVTIAIISCLIALNLRSQIKVRQQVETELKHARSFLHSVVENLPVGIFIKEASELRFIFWNKANEELVGYSQQEVLGKNDYDFFPSEDAEFFILKDREVLTTGEALDIPGEVIHTPHQGIRLLHTKKIPIFDEAGIPQYLLGISEDISERKWAEEELLREHRRTQLFAEITLKIRQSLQFEAIVKTTVEEVLQLLVTDRVIIYRIEPDGSGTVVTEAVSQGCPAILGENIKDPCFRDEYVERYRQGRVRAIEDIENGEVQKCHVELLQRFNVKANLVVPILQGEKLWGLLIAHQCYQTRKWTPFEIDLLQQLADQLSIALAQADTMNRISALLDQQTRTTLLLAEKNQALEQALQHLKQAQAQIVQSEKMASLGQLVAGVAHEINNPVSFIYGNVKPAREYAEDLLDLLRLYEEHYPNPVTEIQQKQQQIDLTFLTEDFPKLLSSMREGAKRIREIVKSLQNFSRLDEAEKKQVDVHEGLDSTLLILNHRFHKRANFPGIEIIKEYADLPLVECYPRQLNQVFMNLLVNAIDALDETVCQQLLVTAHNGKGFSSPFNLSSPVTPTIRISTEVVESHHSADRWNQSVLVRIADNGMGIPEELQQRLFDPFFTTKPVGKGTGLGLSVSYQIIVNQHGGKIECHSKPGFGTEFVIQLPVQQLG